MKKVVKINAIIVLIVLLFTMAPINSIIYAAGVYLQISAAPTPMPVYEGSTITFNLSYTGDINIISLNSSFVKLNGFSALINITGTGNNRTLSLSNISGYGINKSVTIISGSALSSTGILANAISTSSFEIIAKPLKTVDNTPPVVTITGPDISKVYEGATINYIVTFSDNVSVSNVSLNQNSITLNGFFANKEITGTGNTRKITLKNISGSVGTNKNITIGVGTAIDSSGNISAKTTSRSFEILKKVTTVPITPVTPTPKQETKSVQNVTVVPNTVTENTQNVEEKSQSSKISLVKASSEFDLGYINNELDIFSSWLRSDSINKNSLFEKSSAYKDKAMTYYIEYYNGKTVDATNIKIELNIPKGVSIIRVTGNPKLVENTETNTVLQWNIDKVATHKASRFVVEVKFLKDEALSISEDSSNIFYTQLKETEGENINYSYLKQIYIDKNISKLSKYTHKLSTFDYFNTVRPNDEVTRAEFAKMLADVGLLNTDNMKKEYKKYIDYKKIPSYALDSVSALSYTYIMNDNTDNLFKPNYPILRSELMLILEKLIENTDSKLSNAKPTFIYDSVLTDNNQTIIKEKDAIMSLIRQNIIEADVSKVRPYEYATRKEAINMLNLITHRGAYENNLIESNLIIMNKSKYFYGISNMLKEYYYRYDKNGYKFLSVDEK